MSSSLSNALRIIVVLLAVLAPGWAGAQSAYHVQMQLDLDGRKFEVPMTMLTTADKTLVPSTPSGLSVYVRPIAMPGVAGQALLDVQVYEFKGSAQIRLASLTMPSYLGTQNSAEVATSAKGKLTVNAYLDQGAAPAAGPAAASTAAPVATTARPAPRPSPAYEAPASAPAPASSPFPPPEQFRTPRHVDDTLPAPKPIN